MIGLTSGSLTGSTIANFVSSMVETIEAGKPKNYSLSGNIDFDLSVVQTIEGSGKIDLKVVGFGGDITNAQTQRVRFSISPTDEVSEAKKRAEIEEARQRETKAKLLADKQEEAIQSNNIQKKLNPMRKLGF